MAIFGTSMNIADNKKYDANKVSENVIKKEDVIKKNAKLAQLFEKFDTDGNGSLDSFEQAKAMDYLKALDKNKNNKVSNEEFKEAAKAFGLKAGDVKKFFKNVFNASKDEPKVNAQEVKNDKELRDFNAKIEGQKQLSESNEALTAELNKEIAEIELPEAPKDETPVSPFDKGNKMTVSNSKNPNGTIEGDIINTTKDADGNPESFTVKSAASGKEFTYTYDNESGCFVNKAENKYYTIENNQLVRNNELGKKTLAPNELEEIVVTAKAPDKTKLAEAKKLGVGYAGAGNYYQKTTSDGSKEYYEWNKETGKYEKNENIKLVSTEKDGSYSVYTKAKNEKGNDINYYSPDGELQKTLTSTGMVTRYSDGGKSYKIHDSIGNLITEVKNGETTFDAKAEAEKAKNMKEMNNWIPIKDLGGGFSIRKEPGIFNWNPKCCIFDKEGKKYTQEEYNAIKNK